MYEELIQKLREDVELHKSIYQTSTVNEHFVGVMEEAADAIEELSRIEHDFRNYISDQVNRTQGVYACCFCKNRESASRYEPGCKMEECDGVSGWEYGTPKEGDA